MASVTIVVRVDETELGAPAGAPSQCLDGPGLTP